MKIRIDIFGAGVLVAACLMAAQASARPVVWTEQRAYWEVNDHWEAMVYLQERMEPTADDQIFRKFKVNPRLVWHQSERYDFGVGYARICTWQDDGTSDPENRGQFFMTLKWQLGDWHLTSRQRFDACFFEDKEWVGLARHRVGVEYGAWREQWHLRPFVDDEWFFNTREGEIAENRLRVGVKYDITKQLSVDVYGMRRDKWDPLLGEQAIPVAGVHLNWKF